MNSRKKSAIVIFTLFFILFIQLSYAQTLQYLYPNFNITVPSLSSLNQNQNQTPPVQYYTFFVETGNGRYIKYINKVYGPYSTPPFQIPYAQALSGSTAFLNIIGHYDTIKPPKGLLYAVPASNGVTTPLPPQTNLVAGSNIGFNYSDSSVVIGDTMTLVITYKPDSVKNNIIAFFYNDNNAPIAGKVFTEINNPYQQYPFMNSINNRMQLRNMIRIKEEDPTSMSSTVPNGIPGQVSNSLAIAKGNFNNAIYFIPSTIRNSDERNIFISMASQLKPIFIGTSTNIKAVLIKYIGTTVTAEPINLTLPVGQFASDPNGIRTTPNCLDDFPDGPFNKPINYEITFNNQGGGDAKHIEVTVLIPEGIQFPPKNKYGLLSNIKSTIGRKSIVFEKKTQSGINSTETNKKYLNTYELVTSGGQRKIIFYMKNISLRGTSREPKDILRRQGIISFTLNTIARDPQDPNTAIPECMYSDVEIVFTSLIGNEETRGTPIKGHDLIRVNCKFSLLKCPRISTAVFPLPTQ